MAQKTLSIVSRDNLRSRASQKLRAEGKIPAVMYGHSEPINIAIDAREFNTKFRVITENTLIILDNGKDQYEVLVKEYQDDLKTGEVLHIDFYEVEKGKPLKTHVPIKLTGTSVGVKEGGLLEHFLHEVEVECIPKNLPEIITVDITPIKIGQSIHISDINPPEGVKFLTSGDQVVIVVAGAKEEKVVAADDEQKEE